ncbi:hypothetical protein ANN_15971 [Periplaneta americana]|uniref:Uncharacterized protein n=1 Tax=Periplaneta americana TaxID=6978 RepID=A0ABQ8SHP9_PERAM|nr:hypothetical protein ANN_15971 [Periplaneta americana]
MTAKNIQRRNVQNSESQKIGLQTFFGKGYDLIRNMLRKFKRAEYYYDYYTLTTSYYVEINLQTKDTLRVQWSYMHPLQRQQAYCTYVDADSYRRTAASEQPSGESPSFTTILNNR